MLFRSGELDLSPDFQRRGNLWNEQQKSNLIESLLLRIPIPSLYVSEDKDGDYAVVDGLQRLCAITHFVDHVALNKAVKKTLNPLRLTGLESLKEYDNKTYDELPRPLQRRIKETELTLHVIRASTPADVKFNIFSRINRGGLPLTAQEIRNAIYKGTWREKIRMLSLNPHFFLSTEGKIKGERMEDLELVLRFVAHYTLAQRKGSRSTEENLDNFLNNFVEKESAKLSENDWQDIEKAFGKAMIAAPKVFGKLAFRKYSAPSTARKPINRGLFESESVALACRSEKELEILALNMSKVIESYGKSIERNQDFISSLLYATGRGAASNIRLNVFNNIFNEVISAQIHTP